MAEQITFTLNEEQIHGEFGITFSQIAKRINPSADIYILNGFPVASDTVIAEGDSCWLLQRGYKPTLEEMRFFLYARHSPGVQKKIENANVGIMGLGGLGSAVAVALARIGIGKLLVADYDVVEPTNLNRQQYFWDQIGLLKTKAISEVLARVNPYTHVDAINERLTEQTIAQHFHQVDALAECFDDSAMKAAALRCVLTSLPNMKYVTASGVAGYGSSNTIRTTRIKEHIYMIGDGSSEARPGVGLMAPRVGIAAHHQANQILRMLLGKD